MITRHKPEKPYNGLTVVLSNPSRSDINYLISGYAGIMFNEFLTLSSTSRWNCDIRLADSINEPLLPNTKGLLLLGERALHDWCPSYKDYKLTELRGTPLNHSSGLPCIVSFAPQDACDMQNHEARLNPLLQGAEEEKGKEDDSLVKHRSVVIKRNNFRFWLGQDIRKILWRINGGEIYKEDAIIKIYPRAEEIIPLLTETRDRDFFFDIETDTDRNLTCVGFSFSGDNRVFSVPIHDYNYQLFYGRKTYNILRAVAAASCRNRNVIHHAMFDLYVMLSKYTLPVGECVYDTMLAQQRCFPEVEKGLGVSLSCWPQIWEAYHKDEGIFNPRNSSQERQLLEYNGKDIISLKLLKRAQEEYARHDFGLQASIEQANESVYAFLINTLTGVRVNAEEMRKKVEQNDKMLDQYMRAVNFLTGPHVNLLPSSSQSCVKYFHDCLGYPVIGRSKKTGAPSLDETNLLKLKLKNPLNLVIDFCIKYRGLVKQSGSLKALPLEGWHEE